LKPAPKGLRVCFRVKIHKTSRLAKKLCHNCGLSFSNGWEITPKQMHRKWFAVQMTGPRLIEQDQPFRVVRV